jgi:hypothetical protein
MINLSQLKENLQNNSISYDNLVKIVNTDDTIAVSDFLELMNDNIAEQIKINDFNILIEHIEKIKKNVEEELKSTLVTVQTIEPEEDGGVFTEQYEVVRPNLGILNNFILVTTIVEIRIDFRPEGYSYVGIHLSKYDNNAKRYVSLLGDYNYIHIELDYDGGLGYSSLCSY